MASRKKNAYPPATSATSATSATPPYEQAVLMAIEYLKTHAVVHIGSALGDTQERVAHASKCRSCYDGLKYEIGRKIQNGWTVEPDYMAWVACVLTGAIEAPPPKRGRKANPSNEAEVVDAIQHLVNHGLKPTRNDYKEGKSDSACDAVAEALRVLKRQPRSYGRVSEIWYTRPSACVSDKSGE